MLQGLAALRARGPGVNLVAMEMALRLAPAGLILSSTHLWPEQNAVADALSRQREGTGLPAGLPQTHAVEPVSAGWRILGAVAVAPPRRRRGAASERVWATAINNTVNGP